MAVHLRRYFVQHLHFAVIQLFEIAESVKVVLKVSHLGHSAQYGKYRREPAQIPEGPGCDAPVRLLFLEPESKMLWQGSQCAPSDRFHNHHGNISCHEFGIKVTCLCVFRSRILPIEIIHLYLHKIPVVSVVQRHHLVKAALVSVKGEPQVSDMSRLAFCKQKIHNSRASKTLFKVLASA